MANIYSINDKLYMNIRVDGKRIRRCTGLKDTANNRKKVERDLPSLVMKLKMGDITFDKPRDLTVGYYADVFLENKQHSVKPSTLDRYTHQVAFINKEFGSRSIKELKASDARKWTADLLKTKSVKTVTTYLIVFGGICKEALYDEEIDKNPFEYVRLPKKEKPEIYPFSKDDVQTLLSTSSGQFRNMIALLAYTGMRTGEMIGLKWGDIDWSKKEIYIRRTRDQYGDRSPKSVESKRFVPIFASLKPFLQEQFTRTGLKSEYVFITDHGKAYMSTNEIMKRKWIPLLKSNCFIYRRMYDLRHTFAINMLNSEKFSAVQISRWMGHTTTQMLFSTYARYIKGEKIEIDHDFDVFGVGQNMVKKSLRCQQS